MVVMVVVAAAMLVVVVFSPVIRGINRAVVATELVLAGRDEGEVDVIGAAAEGGVVVEHEVAYGFSGKLAAF